MLRAYLEKITGLATGSDGDLKKKMVADLMKDGLVGEGLTDSRVQIVKNHYPERQGVTNFMV